MTASNFCRQESKLKREENTFLPKKMKKDYYSIKSLLSDHLHVWLYRKPVTVVLTRTFLLFLLLLSSHYLFPWRWQFNTTGTVIAINNGLANYTYSTCACLVLFRFKYMFLQYLLSSSVTTSQGEIEHTTSQYMSSFFTNYILIILKIFALWGYIVYINFFISV